MKSGYGLGRSRVYFQKRKMEGATANAPEKAEGEPEAKI
jgi:hypothetical protein